MTWTTTTVTDSLVLIDEDTWVRLSAVLAITPDTNDGYTALHLAGGILIRTRKSADEVIETLGKAMRPAGPVSVPRG